MSAVEDRCPACGGLVAPDAEWCTQCYRSLREPEPAPAAAAQPAVAVVMTVPDTETPISVTPTLPDDASGEGRREPVDGRREPSWRCPGCGERNLLDLDTCATCGTPFGRLFEEHETAPVVPSRTAVAWSLAFPGLGQMRLGRAADGLARAVLFVWAAATALLVGFSHASSPLLTPVAFVFGLFALAVYGLSALDSRRVAEGGSPFVSSKMLIYSTLGLLALSFSSFLLVVTQATSGLR